MAAHPDFIRRGVGRAILAHCEDAARAEGFRRAEMMATLAGEPLYRACGYAEIERVGRTSMAIRIEVIATRDRGATHLKVTEALFTFVALDEQHRPRPVDPACP